jgi:PAS domain S-box-containing protein
LEWSLNFQMLPKMQRVTKRTRRPASANRELAHSEDRFRSLVEALPDAVYVVSEDRLVFVNLFGMRLLRARSPEQLIGRHISEIINPDHLAKVKRQNRRSYRTGATSSVEEIVMRSLDGSQVSVEALAIPITWDGLPAVEVVARDIRERKGTQQRLREYEKAVEGLEEMIVVVDRDYRYVLANRAFLKYREMEREQVVGRPVSELLHKDIFENHVRRRLDECFRGKVTKYEMRYTYPVLGERDLFISYFPIEGPRGVDRVACVLQDITERKRAEQTLQQWQKQLDLAQNAGLRIGLWDWDVVANTVSWSNET